MRVADGNSVSRRETRGGRLCVPKKPSSENRAVGGWIMQHDGEGAHLFVLRRALRSLDFAFVARLKSAASPVIESLVRSYKYTLDNHKHDTKNFMDNHTENRSRTQQEPLKAGTRSKSVHVRIYYAERVAKGNIMEREDLLRLILT